MTRDPSSAAALSAEAGLGTSSPLRHTRAIAIAERLRGDRLGARLLGLVLLLVFAPLIAVLALVVRCTSAGPALFRQVRLGRGGRPFAMFKLRTMVENAADLQPDSWTRQNDPRVTAAGAILRRWHLDELPQLVNVVRGEMALIGPRPETPRIAQRLRRTIPRYDDRHSVLPGIVGLAQINLPPDTDIESVREKLALDLEYIRTSTLSLDLRMLIWSCARLIGLPFESTTRVLGLRRAVRAPSHGPPSTHRARATARSTPPEEARRSTHHDTDASVNDAAVPSLNCLTVDVEDYFHSNAMDSAVSPSQWHGLPQRVESNTRRLLDLLEAYDTRATFFVLGWVAERYPSLVTDIVSRGHEVACHGYLHRLAYQLGPVEFRRDVQRALAILQDLVGGEVRGFRAASYSIVAGTMWVIDILIELGFEYDSSIFPVRHDLYGIPDFDRFRVRIERPTGAIVEIPPSTVRIAGTNLPVAGGGYLRLAPLGFTRWAIRRLNHVDRQPALVYVHPWELDPDQPRLAVGSRTRFRHYSRLATTERKLKRLLSEFRFAPLREVFADSAAAPARYRPNAA